jgi:alpha-D-ribose 1-methylphosphonate 5-triphosphate synthase subunit PhnI
MEATETRAFVAEEAIRAAERLEREAHDHGSLDRQVVEHELRYAVDQVMSEAGLYAPRLAARAIIEAQGDLAEAAFMLRAYRTTVPRLASSRALQTGTMRLERRISSTFKEVPGGQILGPTRDYSQRMLGLCAVEPSRSDGSATPRCGHADGNAPGGANGSAAPNGAAGAARVDGTLPSSVTGLLREAGLVKQRPERTRPKAPVDLTRAPLSIPAPRSARLQGLARGETGAMTALAYSSQRGFGPLHPTLAEFRVGHLPIRVEHPLTGEAVEIGEIVCTEAEVVGKGADVDEEARASDGGALPAMGLGYGLVVGRNERKAIAMALLDGTLDAGRARPEGPTAPAEDEEFVLHHVDGVEAGGFVEHLKLPHHVTFQSALDRVRRVQQRITAEGDTRDS